MELKEFYGKLTKNVRMIKDQDLRKRGEKTEKYFIKAGRKIKRDLKFEIQRVDWLSDKYILLYGLRNWTWRLIIEGVIDENMQEFQDDSENKKVDVRHIRLLWYTFLEVVGV